MTGEAAPDRRVFEIAGLEAKPFLQGLVTNDLGRLRDGLVYAALLSPQGKYLADFFLVPDAGRILLDAHADQAEALGRRLAMYRLRAEVTITPTDLKVTRGLGDAPEGAFVDPRHPALGWRLYGTEEGGPAQIDWDAIRVAHCIPETGVELIPEETYILEAGFERLNGVDFRKGCYVGQEVTARMKHKTELRKGLASVTVDGKAPAGTEIIAEGKPVGRLFTQSGGRGIAYLRLDRAGGEMRAGTARIALA
ncbi:folate-binding protein [Defluviimonas sp. D31]|uniref:CAF17-like 4Fe-4S cluster assembly/insertion protein YgfZ n=1 Tax=Defluviimonas sp. D31 TaxID=3083253 RepID=UPI00296E7AD6|nr:folate-binding protein [Defluviimonas sp. D31]MDW4549495.1 folate-binding protein [Defluviimonas sp. D31]